MDMRHHVYRPCLLPNVIGRGGRILEAVVETRGYSGIGAEEIDRTLMGLRLGNQVPDLLFTRNVAADGDPVDARRDGLCGLQVDIGHHHFPRAGLVERFA